MTKHVAFSDVVKVELVGREGSACIAAEMIVRALDENWGPVCEEAKRDRITQMWHADVLVFTNI